MAAVYRTSAAGGSSSGTGNRTATITPAVGDLLIIYCFVAANTNDTPTCSDNNGSGTYDRIDVMNASIAAINYRLSVFIRTALMVNTTSTTVTVATGSNTSGVVHVIAVSGMSRVGTDAVRSKGSQNNQAAGTAAPVLNQSALTGNVTIVAHGSADTTTTAPTNWTERQDTSQSNDTVALENATRDSGFTGTAITFGAASSTVFCSHALELDGSALLTRTVLVDGVGAVTSAAAFFSIFSRSSLVDAVGDVTIAGQRDLLRATSVNGNGSLVASGTFFSVFSGQSTLDTIGVITSSATFFSFFAAGTSIDAAGAILSSATWFSIVSGASLLDAAGSIASNGETETPAGDHERAVAIDVAGGVISVGLCIREQAVNVGATGTIEISASFFSITEGTSALDATCGIESIGQRDILRSLIIDATVEIITSTSFFSIFESSGELLTAVAIESSGTIGGNEHERSITINGIGDILASTSVVHVVSFNPRQLVIIGSTSRLVAIGNEDRVRVIETEIQSGSI
jgi:hypothetical protein